MAPDPKRILVIHFGQLGDVVLGLPAFDAIRGRFPDARITALTGKPADQIARMAGLVDDVVAVDRVALKYGPKLRSVHDIARFVLALRRARYDAVVDLHAFYETGLIARFTGAKLRVGPLRENRTLASAYTATAPPEDRSAHLVDRYLAVAAAAGANARTREPRVAPTADDARVADELLARRFPSPRARLVGLNPGSGFAPRRWPAARFAELGRTLADEGANIAVFGGPEERGLADEIATEIGPAAAAVEGLTLAQLAAAFARCALVVSNDTGPSHIAAAAGAPTLVLMPGNLGESPFAVRGKTCRCIYGETIDAITVAEALEAARALIALDTQNGETKSQ